MKFNSRICVRCGGSKTITKYVKPFDGDRDDDNPKFEKWIQDTHFNECPNCNGEGIEYIISPNQLKEYKILKDLKELVDDPIS